MLTIPVYNTSGEQVGEESIDPADFGGSINKQLLHDVVVMHLANRRVGTVNTRGRSDVAGSTRKMYRQKGTGNARMGSKRTNKRVGGGVAFARRNRDYSYRLPKKAIRLAIRMAILSKFQDGQAFVLQGLDLGATPKTKDVVRILRSIRRPDLPAEAQPVEGETKRDALRRTLDGRKLLIGTAEFDHAVYRGARNIPGVMVAPVAEFNTYDVLRQRYLVLTPEALGSLKERVKEKVRRRPEVEAAAAG
ncbi:50S ribosomal protein L4 [Tautonia plasticadhaerens]|uniref:Large ribosomal subunit protein uL4 n=1 Tax=Tautonia plasticadhaerens TaxID=2527974 RepID=A0A518GUC5_9BACT|nr:50S ribosomal protein L4 [Tautonia plasticadhaerens]QDV32190.1 50S ribosomal protein L4 [Tautonia plasticadhaerens]